MHIVWSLPGPSSVLSEPRGLGELAGLLGTQALEVVLDLLTSQLGITESNCLESDMYISDYNNILYKYIYIYIYLYT